MKLSRASSYALHALVYMAGQQNGKPIASHVAARDQHIPERFLLKVLKPLVSAGVLRSVKGPNGGYRLARPANKITLLEIVEAVDGPIRGQVPLDPDGKITALDRRLQEVCEQAANQWRRQLEKVRISELADKSK